MKVCVPPSQRPGRKDPSFDHAPVRSVIDDPHQLLVALRAGESEPEPLRLGSDRVAAVGARHGEANPVRAPPRCGVGEVRPLDRARFSDRLDLARRGLVAAIVDEPDDPRRILGVQIRPLVALGI